jgi:hypothetical protein
MEPPVWFDMLAATPSSPSLSGRRVLLGAKDVDDTALGAGESRTAWLVSKRPGPAAQRDRAE